jgi:hypothetical protein
MLLAANFLKHTVKLGIGAPTPYTPLYLTTFALNFAIPIYTKY